MSELFFYILTEQILHVACVCVQSISVNKKLNEGSASLSQSSRIADNPVIVANIIRGSVEIFHEFSNISGQRGSLRGIMKTTSAFVSSPR